MIATWLAAVICLSVGTLIFLLLLTIVLLLPLLVIMVVPLYRMRLSKHQITIGGYVRWASDRY